MTEIEKLEQAIAALEAQRSTLGDGVVDTALAPLREKLGALEAQHLPPEHQRKLLTILFMDIVGSTQMSRDRDPEEIMEIMDGALKTLAAPIEAHGGRVTRYMGDGFKALFGLPVAHENDPEQAVRAGLQILEVARDYASQLESEHQIPGFNVRIGINTGLVVTGGFSEAEDTVMGMTVNLAARMESAAPPGGVLVSHHTYQFVRGIFDMQEMEPVKVKGFDEAVPSYLVERPKPRTFHRVTRGMEDLKIPLIGRERELKQLQDIFTHTIQDSSSQIVTLIGDPGIGKSRLLDEFSDWLDQYPEPVHKLYGRAAQQIMGTPYSLLHDLFAYRFDILDSDPAPLAFQKLETGLRDFLDDEPQMKAHFIGSLLGFDLSESPFITNIQDDPSQLRERALFYLSQYICSLTEKYPAAIFLEDFHYADTPSLEAISRIAYACSENRLVIICLARPMLFERHPQWGHATDEAGSTHTSIPLPPLTPQASQQLIQNILKLVDITPSKLLNLLTATCEGNPFYIEESINMLIEDGVIIKEDDEAWRVITEKLQDLRIPPSLTAVLQARLDSLPLAEKVTLQQAAVVGRVFWDTVLQVLQGESQSTIQVLKSISQRELIYPQPVPIIQDAHEFTFKNSLLRDVAYETVLKRVRQAYHAQVADWLVEALQSSGRVDEYSAVIAEHYAQAGENAPAADWYTRAGERAKAQGTPLEARRFFDRALEFMPPTDLEQCWKALIGREEVLGLLGENEARQRDNEALLALAEELNDDYHLALAYYRQAHTLHIRGDDRLALESYENSFQAAQRAGDLRLQTLVSSLKVISFTRLSELNEAAKTAEDTLNLTETLSEDIVKAQVLTNLAVFYSESGDIARATQLYLQIAETTNRVDERFGQSIALSNLGYNYILLGLYDQAIETLNESIQRAESIGARHQSAFSRLNLGLAMFRNGDGDKARGELERVINELESMGDRFGQAASCTYLGLTLEALGEPASASRYYKNAEEIHNDIGVRGYACDARIGLARCFLSLGETEEANQLAEYSWKELEVHGPTGIEFPIMLYKSCADIFEAMGQLENAQRAVEAGYTELMEHARAISNPGWRKSYLENVHEHCMIIELWESLSSQETIQAIKGDNNGSRKEV